MRRLKSGTRALELEMSRDRMCARLRELELGSYSHAVKGAPLPHNSFSTNGFLGFPPIKTWPTLNLLTHLWLQRQVSHGNASIFSAACTHHPCGSSDGRTAGCSLPRGYALADLPWEDLRLAKKEGGFLYEPSLIGCKV